MAKPICGVNSSIIKPYNFEDHIWMVGKVSDEQIYDPSDLLELSRKCVMVGDKYYHKIPGFRNSWRCYKTLDAAQKGAENSWKLEQLSSGNFIDDKMIETFFSGKEERIVEVDKKADKKVFVKVGSCPHLDNTISIPLGPQFVTYNEKHCFNEDNTNIMIGNNQDVTHHDTQKLLTLIYRSLCDQEEICENEEDQFYEILKQIATNNYSNLEIKLIMNWLAAIYQKPGINLQLNLWVVGEQNGVGKGTLAEVMKSILGQNAVGNFDKVEVEKGWTGNSLLGKILVVWDEFGVGGNGKWSQQEWVDWIKQNTCETNSTIKYKGDNEYQVINIGNHIIFSNNLYPIVKFDQTNRRDAFIKTTDDPKWKRVATYIRGLKNDSLDAWHCMCSGFAWILENVMVDEEFLKTPPLTKHRIAVMAESKSQLQQVLDIIAIPEIDDDGNRIVGQYDIPSDVMHKHEKMREYINDYLLAHGLSEITRVSLSRELKTYFKEYDGKNGKLLDKHKPDTIGFYYNDGRNVYFCITSDPEKYIKEHMKMHLKPVGKTVSRSKQKLWEMQKTLRSDLR